jgi:hypothetical protein
MYLIYTEQLTSLQELHCSDLSSLCACLGARKVVDNVVQASGVNLNGIGVNSISSLIITVTNRDEPTTNQQCRKYIPRINPCFTTADVTHNAAVSCPQRADNHGS